MFPVIIGRILFCLLTSHTKPPLKKLEDEYVQLMSDKNKFISFLDQQGQKMEKIRLRISKVKEAVISQGQ